MKNEIIPRKREFMDVHNMLFEQKFVALQVYDLEFDDVTPLKELKYKVRCNFKNYWKFLKSPVERL